MGRMEYGTHTYQGHPVKIIHKYPREEEIYFECERCRTRYSVAKHYTQNIPTGGSEIRRNVHDCPVCGHKNKGLPRRPDISYPAGSPYEDDWI